MRIEAALLIAMLSACSNDTSSLHPNIQKHYPSSIKRLDPFHHSCSAPLACGDLVMIACSPELNGSMDYYNNRTGKLVMACGGACMDAPNENPLICRECPPPEWRACEGKPQ